MSGLLLDTNILSELTRIKPEPRVTEWLAGVVVEQVYVSVLTLGEMRKGIALPRKANGVLNSRNSSEPCWSLGFPSTFCPWIGTLPTDGDCLRLKPRSPERLWPWLMGCSRQPPRSTI